MISFLNMNKRCLVAAVLILLSVSRVSSAQNNIIIEGKNNQHEPVVQPGATVTFHHDHNPGLPVQIYFQGDNPCMGAQNPVPGTCVIAALSGGITSKQFKYEYCSDYQQHQLWCIASLRWSYSQNLRVEGPSAGNGTATEIDLDHSKGIYIGDPGRQDVFHFRGAPAATAKYAKFKVAPPCRNLPVGTSSLYDICRVYNPDSSQDYVADFDLCTIASGSGCVDPTIRVLKSGQGPLVDIALDWIHWLLVAAFFAFLALSGFGIKTKFKHKHIRKEAAI